MSVALGDLTQIPVTTRPTQGLPALGDTMVTLYNQDITNVVYVSYQQWFAPGAGNSVPIQPLTSITISAKRAIYVAATVATSPLMVLPEGSQAQPSPAQIATQISALGLATEATQLGQATTIPAGIFGTGVPLYTKSNSLIDTGVQTIAAAGQFLSALTAFSQIGYEIFINAIENTTVGATPLNTVSVTLSWVDSVSNKTVDTDTWRVFPGNGVGGSNSYIGAGPTKGDKVQILISNLDTVACNVQVIILQNSRVYTRDDVRGTPNVVTGQTLASIIDIPSNFLGSRFIASLGIGATDVAIPGFFSGKVKLHWDSGSNAADCEMILTAESLGGVAGGSVVYDKFSDGTGNGNDEFYLARVGYTVSVVNHNAAAKQVRWRITIGEY